MPWLRLRLTSVLQHQLGLWNSEMENCSLALRQESEGASKAPARNSSQLPHQLAVLHHKHQLLCPWRRECGSSTPFNNSNTARLNTVNVL